MSVAAAAAIGAASRLALACHVGPDGDALGSMLGLGVAARAAGKEVVASFGSPFEVPSNLSFLPTELLVPPDRFPQAPEVMVVLDAGSPDRLAELASNASNAGVVVVIDHHATNHGFGDVAIIDPDAPATGYLVRHLLSSLGWELTAEVATCLLTALVTDTGRFQYGNTTPETLQMAAELVAAGARPEVIARHVYEQAPFGYLKAAGAALSRARLDPELGVVSTWLSEDDLEGAGIDWGDIDNLIDTVRLAEEADVAILAKAHRDGRVRVSLRSRGATDVGALAAALGGGGHRLASGLTTEGPVEDVIAAVVEKVGGYR